MKQKTKWLILLSYCNVKFHQFLANEQSVASEVKELEKVVTGVTSIRSIRQYIRTRTKMEVSIKNESRISIENDLDLSKYNGNLSMVIILK